MQRNLPCITQHIIQREESSGSTVTGLAVKVNPAVGGQLPHAKDEAVHFFVSRQSAILYRDPNIISSVRSDDFAFGGHLRNNDIRRCLTTSAFQCVFVENGQFHAWSQLLNLTFFITDNCIMESADFVPVRRLHVDRLPIKENVFFLPQVEDCDWAMKLCVYLL